MTIGDLARLLEHDLPLTLLEAPEDGQDEEEACEGHRHVHGAF